MDSLYYYKSKLQIEERMLKMLINYQFSFFMYSALIFHQPLATLHSNLTRKYSLYTVQYM
jgi:hypothetical protein